MLNDLVDKIYEAAFVPDSWVDALKSASWVSDSASGAIFVFNEGLQPRGRSTPNVQSELDAFVASESWKISDSVQNMYRLQPAAFVQVDDFLTVEEIENDPVRKRLRAAGIGVHLCTAIPMPSGELVTIVFARGLNDGGYPRPVVEQLEALRPHLSRAALISARLELERAEATVSTLAALGLPAALLTGSGRVLASNALFESTSAVLRPTAFGGISLPDAAADALFQQAVANAREGQNGGIGSIPILATEGTPPRVLHVLPVRGAARDIFAGGQVLVVVTAVRVGPALSQEVLHGLFDLTPAECRLAAALVNGSSVTRAASEIGTTVKTARTYLERVFRKTGTHQQGQLVSLLKNIGPPSR
jgi:DNA-binding CsgD family transcriptional regulator